MEKSFFEAPQAKERQSVSANAEFDCVIIGAGLAGLACGLSLIKQGHNVCVLEAAEVGSGQTPRSSAMITFAHDPIYYRLIKKHGLETAAEFLRLQKLGAEKLEEAINEHSIDCDYTKTDFSLYATTEKGAKEIKQEKEAYTKLGVSFSQFHDSELPLNITEQLILEDQAHLNPAKFLAGLAAAFESLGGVIYERSRVVKEPEEKYVEVNGCNIGYKHLIIASHYPYVNIFPNFFFIKLYQHRNHNMVFENGLKLKNMYEGCDDEWYEFRPVESGVLVGGGAARTGTDGHVSRFEEMERYLSENFGVTPQQIVSRFSAQDVMTFDLMPYVGKASRLWNNVYVVTGFNKWGFTNAFAAAEIIADMIIEAGSKNSPSPKGCPKGGVADTEGGVKNIFSPQRASLVMAPVKSVQNLGHIVSAFAELVLNAQQKNIQRIGLEQGAVVKHKGQRIGVYKDKNGKPCCVSAICPHMGCALTWNKDEKSWDCPCHGSRFDYKGQLLDNPALEDLEKKELE
ncbi:MAG: FAD-dependent oxidoreductase [Firmicutes bacterium]|nr:FAD-dependent oxidoreductase [Bacillota bacterium]